MAATLNVTVCPASTVWLCGGVVIAAGALVSNKATTELVALPKRFVTVTE